ncbi:MAG: phosphatase PAP2 family protein [Deltaproteobacteria bacterium]|nr:phosphatase PAP2 family protein [Deltaproteobacteria bacterium]
MKHHLRFFIAVLFAAWFVVTYFAIRHYVVSRGVFYVPMFLWEKEIPFLPWTFFIYVLVYVTPLAAFLLLNTTESLKACFKSFFVSLTLHQIVWLVYPVKLEIRPMIDPNGGDWLVKMADAFLKLDTPAVNCLPSLHVTYAFLSYFAIHAYRPRLAPWFLFLAVVISLSTMTFKQHYAADVAAGILTALLMKWIFLKPHRRGLSK